mgnify:CR=1 FL=1
MHAKSFQLCPTLGDPMHCSTLGSSAHGILQARILEWVAVPFSRDLPNSEIEPVSHVSGIGRPVLYHQRHRGSPISIVVTPIYIPTNTVGEFPFLHTLSSIRYL